MMADASGIFINKIFDEFSNATIEVDVIGDDGKTTKKTRSFFQHLEDQIKALGEGDSSNPQKLAMYQKAMMMFTVHTNTQASTIKGIGDMDKGIIRDFN